MQVFRSVPILLFACAAAFSLPAAAEDAPQATKVKPSSISYQKQKVVYHITDAEVAGVALRNAQNHINAVGADRVNIVVVTHGKGVDFLLEDWKDSNGKSYETAIQDLANQGVKFDVCNNTLVGRKLDPEKLNMNAEIVPSGVATVSELQMQGYVYLKP